MSNEFLSQDEVDALIQGVSGEPAAADDTAAEAASAPRGEVRPYDLAKEEKTVRGRMPTLDVINDRFGRSLRLALFNFMRRNPEISTGPVKVIKYADFLRNLIVPTNLNIMQLRPLRGNALFVIDPGLVFTVIDNLFGGDGRFKLRIEGREFTPTELRIILKMLGVINDEYRNAWAPVYPLQCDYLRSEMHTQFANIAKPTDIVVVSTFSVEIGAGGGDIHICIPYASIEPLRSQLASLTPVDGGEPDRQWADLLSAQMQSASVEIVVPLAEAALPLGHLAKIEAGEIIPIEMAPTLTASVDGIPVFDCRYGTLNGKFAVKVEKILAGARELKSSGAMHVR